MQRALRAETQHLERMADELGSLDAVERGARLLAASRPLPVLGLRAAGATAMLAIVLPRYPRETLEVIREARGTGLAVVALTDSAVSPVAGHADVVLPAPVGTQLVFDLHTGPMAMAMVLLQAMCDAAPEQAQRRLEEFEATASRRHLFEA
jgi:DNA-binding MurR/RpiR family transcriptional regulator